MAGGTKSHNLITQNSTMALRGSLRGKGCQVYMEDVRLAVQDDSHYTYPDVVVTCDPADVLEIPDLHLCLPLADVYDDTDVASLVVEEPASPRW
jgi:hypothetical protein